MSRGRLIVGATVASFPGNGGIAWERLSWVLGFRRLGHDVIWVDQLGRNHCMHPVGSVGEGYDGCINISWFESIVERFGLAGSVSLIGDDGESLSGLSFEHALEMAGDAELLVNPGGDLRHAAFKQRARRAVYIDVDPGFTQLWLASGRPVPRVEGHDVHFTIGENVGTSASDLPTAGIEWRHTRQPVVLDDWPFAHEVAEPRFTTVGRWRGVGPHGPLDDIEQPFTSKGDELMRVLDVPERTGIAFELVLETRGDDEPRALLERHGWRVVDPATVAADPDSLSSLRPGVVGGVLRGQGRLRRDATGGSASAPLDISPRAGQRSCRTPASRERCPWVRACSRSGRSKRPSRGCATSPRTPRVTELLRAGSPRNTSSRTRFSLACSRTPI